MNNHDTGFKCPLCSADMLLDASSHTLTCKACGRSGDMSVEDRSVVSFDFAAEEIKPILQDWGMPVQTAACDTCGAKIVSLVSEETGSCPFCGSEHMTAANEAPGIKPAQLIPFKISEAEALERFTSWMQKRYLAPFPFAAEYAQHQIKGVYLPYWSFDADVKAAYMGQAADHYLDTEEETVTLSDRTETKKLRVKKLRWRFVSGTLEKTFRQIIFNDAGPLDEKVIEKLEPYKLSDAQNFSAKHLAGFSVGKTKNGLRAVWQRAQSFMDASVRGDAYDILKRGSDAVGTIHVSADYGRIAYRQLLLPVWISSYRYRQRTYHVYMNGQTGEIFGEFPKSLLKIGILALAAVAAVALFIWLM